MSIATQITRLQNAKSSLKTAIENKGVTVPSSAKLDGYAEYVDAIEQGGGGGSAVPNLVGWIAKAAIPIPDVNMDGMANIQDNTLLLNARANLAQGQIFPLLGGTYETIAAFDATLKAPDAASATLQLRYLADMNFAYMDDDTGEDKAELPVPIPLLSIDGEERWIVASVYKWILNNAYEYRFYAVYDGFPYDPGLKLGYNGNIS